MTARTVTVELSEDQARWIEERIEAREHPDAASVVRGVLDARLIEDEQTHPEHDDAVIREAVAPVLERMRNGTAVWHSHEDVFGRMSERRLARKTAR